MEVESNAPPFSQVEKIKKKRKKALPVDATIQVFHNQPEKIAPIVGYFPSGFDPFKNSDDSKSSKVRLFRHKARASRLELVVSPSGSNVNFVGSSYSGEATAPQLCTYTLGILDKETQTLKIVPIANNKIFRLQPRVGGSDHTDKETVKLAKEELSPEKKADRMRELTNLYGTKKSISQAKKMHSLNQEEDPSSQKDMDRIIKDVVINKEALESASAHTARNIPPYDSNATKPEEAYPLDKIILKGDWDYLGDGKLLNAEEVLSDAYPTFVRNRVHKLGNIQDKLEKETLACIFSYITHLIKYKDQHSMDGVSSAKNHRIPSILRQKFSTMFGGTESKRMEPVKNDLLISYVLVLTLFADGFKTDPSDIATDLRMSSFTLRLHFQNLGCKLLMEKNALKATLPVPLQFPKLKKRRRVDG